MATVAIDARDAHVPMPHGSGVYVRALLPALLEAAEEIALWPLERGGRGPELWWEQVTLPRLLRRRRPALVHSPNCFLPLRRPCPGVVTIHDLAFHDFPRDFPARTGWKYRTFTPRAARSAQRVICPSRFTREDVCRRYGVPAERTRVIPQAPALERGDAEPPPGPYLLAVGDLRPKKNLARLVEAWLRLRERGLEHRLVIAGADFGEAARLEAMAGEQPLELTGYAPARDVDALLRGADLLVQPGLYEGFGMIVVEAMERGCPVAVSRGGALEETAAGAAAMFDPHDAAAIATTIERVLGDSDERERLIEAGERRAGALSWEDTARRTLLVYEELL